MPYVKNSKCSKKVEYKIEVIEKIEKEEDPRHLQDLLPLLQDQEEEVETNLKKDNIDINLQDLLVKVENQTLQKHQGAQGNDNILYCSKNA